MQTPVVIEFNIRPCKNRFQLINDPRDYLIGTGTIGPGRRIWIEDCNRLIIALFGSRIARNGISRASRNARLNGSVVCQLCRLGDRYRARFYCEYRCYRNVLFNYLWIGDSRPRIERIFIILGTRGRGSGHIGTAYRKRIVRSTYRLSVIRSNGRDIHTSIVGIVRNYRHLILVLYALEYRCDGDITYDSTRVGNSRPRVEEITILRSR